MYLFYLTDDIVISTAKVLATAKIPPKTIAVTFQGRDESLMIDYDSADERNDKFNELIAALANSKTV